MNTSNKPPGDDDWKSEVLCLDAQAAFENFFGLNVQQAEQLFVDNAICREEDLMFMPAVCFRYYLPAYINYLKSDASADDGDAASCFFGLIEQRLGDIASCGQLLQETSETLRHLSKHQSWYGAREEIYGRFADHAERLFAKVVAL